MDEPGATREMHPVEEPRAEPPVGDGGAGWSAGKKALVIGAVVLAVTAAGIAGTLWQLDRTRDLEARLEEAEDELTRRSRLASGPITTTVEASAPDDEGEGDSAPAPSPAPAPESPDRASGRVFGRIDAMRQADGAWTKMFFDVDEMTFLEGQAALDYLTSVGDEDFYHEDYWYARNDDLSITTYETSDPHGVAVTMYTWPVAPTHVPFYPDHLNPQEMVFGIFYDEVYMHGNGGLLNSLYWLTLENGDVVAIEEQPSDPYYGP